MKLFAVLLFGLVLFAVSQVHGQGGDKPLGYWVRANCAAFSPDGKTVLVGFGHGKCDKENTPGWDIQLFEVETGKHLRTFGRHTGDVLFVQFFPDGKRFLSLGRDARIRIWDVEKGEHIVSFPGIPSRQAALLRDGKRLLYVSGSLQMVDVVNGKLLKDYKDQIKPPIFWLTVSPDGKLALLGHAHARMFGFDDPILLRLWDVENGKIIRNFDPKDASAHSSVFSDDSNLVLCTRWDSLAKKAHRVLWSVSSDKELKVLPPLASHPVSYHVGVRRNRITVAGSDAFVSWRMDTAEQVYSINPKVSNEFDFFVFRGDGEIALSGGGIARDVTGLELVLWHMHNGRRLHILQPKMEETRRPPSPLEP